jgi:hypothetical protein
MLFDDQTGGLNAEVDNGSYTVRNVRPGLYRLSAAGSYYGFTSEVHKVVTVKGGERLVIDFIVPSPGTITGSVLGENGSPARGVTLRAIDKSYARGVLRYLTVARSTSDGYGRYRFDRLPPSRSLLILADGATVNGPSPADTFFPSTSTPASAQEIVLHPGEERSGVDIRRINGPTYCISGIANADPSSDTMSVAIKRAGPLRDDYFVRDLPIGDPPGKFTLCGLHSGRYQIEVLAAVMKSRPPAFSNSQGTVAIADSDVQGIKLGWRWSLALSGETIWDGVPDSTDATVKLFLHMWGMHRYGGFVPAEPTVAGRFSSVLSLIPEDYEMDRVEVQGGTHAYVKDVTWNAAPILGRIFSLGPDSVSSHLRIVIGVDGGSIRLKAIDKLGHPAPNAYAAIIPTAAQTQDEMALKMTFVETDQNGSWVSGAMQPGRYTILAFDTSQDGAPMLGPPPDPPDLPASLVAKFWNLRSTGKAFEIVPNDVTEARLEPQPLP